MGGTGGFCGARRARVGAVMLGVGILVGVLQPAAAGAATKPAVPAALAVPVGHVQHAVGHARGYQLYTCQPAAGGTFAWVLQAPYAGLLDHAGHGLAVHYGGPSWTAGDGSTVVAARVASAPAPVAGAIPWLLLKTTSTSGPPGGTFTSTTYIQRITTTGGLAPATGCHAGHVGALAPVLYTADYYFFRLGVATSA